VAARPGRTALPRARVTPTTGGPRIAVLGAGSIGCFVGGAWQASGLKVRFIGRDHVAREIASHGLTLTDYRSLQLRIAPLDVDFCCSADGLKGADVILLCVKSGATREAATDIARHARRGAMIVSLQNGVSNMAILAGVLSDGFELARGLVAFNVAHLGKGEFHKGVAGAVLAERLPVLQEIASRVQAGPAALELSDAMLELAWGKLLINLNNAVNALSGRTLADELRERDYRRVFAASIKEGVKLLKLEGITPAALGGVPMGLLPFLLNLPNPLFNAVAARRWKIDAKARSSMADDLARGRLTEIESLNGELIRLAARLGLEAPVNRRIVDLVHQAERGARPLSPKALRAAVLGG
jgi:2-dehydropantoate 2-reductase